MAKKRVITAKGSQLSQNVLRNRSDRELPQECAPTQMRSKQRKTPVCRSVGVDEILNFTSMNQVIIHTIFSQKSVTPRISGHQTAPPFDAGWTGGQLVKDIFFQLGREFSAATAKQYEMVTLVIEHKISCVDLECVVHYYIRSQWNGGFQKTTPFKCSAAFAAVFVHLRLPKDLADDDSLIATVQMRPLGGAFSPCFPPIELHL